jgi:hypothetical protein
MSMNKIASTIKGEFYGMDVTIINKKTIRVMNYDNVPIREFKPYVDKIAQYLIDEGFVTELIPRVEVVVPKG